MNVRETVAQIYRYLRTEQRAIPYGGDTAYLDPLPDVLTAMNGALQEIAVIGPLFAAKEQRSAWFHAPATMTVSSLTNGGMTATGIFPTWANGCQIYLPGDTEMNRINSISGTTATLQFPYLGSDAGGTATIRADTVELAEDIITVLEPVRRRNSRCKILPVNNRDELTRINDGEVRYFIESTQSADRVRNRMMLSGYAETDTVLEFQARTTLGILTAADVYNNDEGYTDPDVPVPVPSGMVEAIFLPIALDRFFSQPSITNYDIPSLRNQDAPALIRQQAQEARQMLAEMKPQGSKPIGLRPALRTPPTGLGYPPNYWSYGSGRY